MSVSRPHLLVTEWLSSVALALAAYHLPFWFSEDWGRPVWLVEVGALAVLFSETGAFLASDYYRHRKSRGKETPPYTLTLEMNPPQIVLKAAWGSYLTAFLCCVVLFLALREDGWVIPLLGVGGFALGYYNEAAPLDWSSRRFTWFFPSIARVWIPWVAGTYVSFSAPARSSVIMATTLFALDLALRGWFQRRFR